MTVTINGSSGITAPEVILDNTTADGGQVVLKSSGYSNWNLDNYSGRLRAYYDSTEYMTITAAGNVGIGTSSPASDSLLHIFSASDKARVSVQRDGVSKAWFGQDGSGTAYIYNEANNDTRFYNNSTERMRLTAAGLLQFNSGYGSVATAYGCRAWVNFNGTGTVAINASGNVSSITDNGTGSYTVNFATSMPDANYSIAGTARSNDGSTGRGRLEPHPTTTPTTSGVRVVTNSIQNVSAERDSPSVYVQIFR